MCRSFYLNLNWIFQGFFVAFIYCFCNGEVIKLSFHFWRANSDLIYCNITSCLSASGAGRGEEGMVKTQPHAGPQTESQDDEQRRWGQLLLRRHDVTHHHTECQLISCQSQGYFLHWRCGVLRWGCWWRPRSQTATPHLSPPTNQPAWIRARWFWDPPTGAGCAEVRGDGVWSFCEACQSRQRESWLQRSGSICSSNPSRRSRQLVISERAGDHPVIVWIKDEILDSCWAMQMNLSCFSILICILQKQDWWPSNLDILKKCRENGHLQFHSNNTNSEIFSYFKMTLKAFNLYALWTILGFFCCTITPTVLSYKKHVLMDI